MSSFPCEWMIELLTSEFVGTGLKLFLLDAGGHGNSYVFSINL